MKQKALCYLAKTILAIAWAVMALVAALCVYVVGSEIWRGIQAHTWGEILWQIAGIAFGFLTIALLILVLTWASERNERC